VTNPLVLTRRELAEIFPNNKAIEAYEQLQDSVVATPDQIAQIQADLDAVTNTANAAAALAGAATTTLNGAQFLTLSTNSGLGAERVLAPSSDFRLTDLGANNNAVLAFNSQTQILPADVSDNTGVFINVTGLAPALEASSTYVIEALLTFQSAGGAVGIGLAFAIPAGASISGSYRHNATATGEQAAYNTASGAVNSNTSAVPAINVNLPIAGRWIIKTGGTAGVAQLQMRSGAAATAVTLKQDLSELICRKIA